MGGRKFIPNCDLAGCGNGRGQCDGMRRTAVAWPISIQIAHGFIAADWNAERYPLQFRICAFELVRPSKQNNQPVSHVCSQITCLCSFLCVDYRRHLLSDVAVHGAQALAHPVLARVV